MIRGHILDISIQRAKSSYLKRQNVCVCVYVSVKKKIDCDVMGCVRRSVSCAETLVIYKKNLTKNPPSFLFDFSGYNHIKRLRYNITWKLGSRSRAPSVVQNIYVQYQGTEIEESQNVVSYFKKSKCWAIKWLDIWCPILFCLYFGSLSLYLKHALESHFDNWSQSWLWDWV